MQVYLYILTPSSAKRGIKYRNLHKALPHNREFRSDRHNKSRREFRDVNFSPWYFCLMRVKIGIRNLGILPVECLRCSRKSVPGWPYCSYGAQFKLYSCVYRETLWYLQSKIGLRNVHYVTHCVSRIFFSLIVKVPLETTWSENCAAHPVACTHHHAVTHTSSQWFMICYQKIFL